MAHLARRTQEMVAGRLRRTSAPNRPPTRAAAHSAVDGGRDSRGRQTRRLFAAQLSEKATVLWGVLTRRTGGESKRFDPSHPPRDRVPIALNSVCSSSPSTMK